MDNTGETRLLERLLMALAAQAYEAPDRRLVPGAIRALSGLGRCESRLLFGNAGHLVHYGTPDELDEELATLIKTIAAIQRSEAPPRAALLPGDAVLETGTVPPALVGYDEGWL